MSNELAILPQFTAVAVNATEMQQANQNIRTWLEAKCLACATVVEETYAALDAATRNGWKTEALRGCHQREKQRHLYYTKLREAVDAGYTIVPNMDVDVFAIRVKREKPAEGERTDVSKYSYPSVSVNAEQEQRLPTGEGRYESPHQLVKTSRGSVKDAEGKVTEYRTLVRPVGFADIEFPLAIANAQVMDATAVAMSMKIFDRIGVVPASLNTRADPIVLGQITLKIGYSIKRASFLIAWYLDPRTL